MKIFHTIFKPGAQAAGPRAPGFLKSFHPQTLVYVCVSAPEAIINKSHEGHA